MSRRAFTLIELLVIIAIMGTMVTVGLVSVRAGQRAARIKGAVRDVYSLMRRARSTALVTQQPAIITYSNNRNDDETTASVEITSAKVIDTVNAVTDVITLTGEPVKGHENDEPAISSMTSKNSSTNAVSGGESLEEVLFAPISDEVIKGVKLKVLTGDAELESSGGIVQKSSISVFSTTDYLVNKLGQKKAADAAAKAKEESSSDSTSKSTASADDMTAPVSVVWETNGRVDAHKVWVYQDGKRPEDGMLLKVDRFGGIKVLNGDGSSEDD